MNEAIRRGDYFKEDGKGASNDDMIAHVVSQVWHQYDQSESGNLTKTAFRLFVIDTLKEMNQEFIESEY
jgi:hypothetical protein